LIGVGVPNLAGVGLAQIGEKHHRTLATAMKDKIFAGRFRLQKVDATASDGTHGRG
jgi:hypothetical protein